MKNTPIEPQKSIGGNNDSSGLGHVERLVSSGLENVGGSGDAGRSEHEERLESEEGKKEVLRKTRKRADFDKEGHPLKRQGHRFRIDHLKIYKIHSALKGISQQELINKALEYYKVNVLQKSGSQKLKEAGQNELEI